MKKNLLKSQKGVTLLSLVITIVVILILTSTVIFQVNDTTEANRLNDLYADINLLEDKILLYYNNYSEIPVIEPEISVVPQGIEKEDTDKFYEIDLTKLRGITLKYGNKTDREDIYIVNNRTLKVYYLKGIEVNGQKHYSV
jgi:type II secretory pathway pseudopilin PulG